MSKLPITKAQWEERKELYRLNPDLCPTAEEAIRNNVDWLIARLYTPDEEVGARCSSAWLETLGLSPLGEELINWGDLYCSEVGEWYGGGWIVTIEEADPGCVGLQGYIARWLTLWGWEPVEVRTDSG